MLPLQLHGGMPDLVIASLRQGPISVHLAVLAQHVHSRDPHLIESQVAIVLRIVSELSANVTHLYPTQWLVALQVTDLHYEVLYSMSFPIYYQLSLSHCMGRCDPLICIINNIY